MTDFAPSTEPTIYSPERFHRTLMDEFGFTVDQVLKFAQALRDTQAVVAGGTVLNSYLPKEQQWKSNDLDIYVNVKQAYHLYLALGEIGWVDNRQSSPRSVSPRSGSHERVDSDNDRPNPPEPSVYNDSFHMASNYDRSFMRKNRIIARQTCHLVAHPKCLLDLMLIDDQVSPISVVNNFDLSICEIWYDGDSVQTHYADHLNNLVAELKPDYVTAYICEKNYFIASRMDKYTQRGFTISFVPPKVVTYQRANSVEDSRTIAQPTTWIFQHLLDWYLQEHVENAVKFLSDYYRPLNSWSDLLAMIESHLRENDESTTANNILLELIKKVAYYLRPKKIITPISGSWSGTELIEFDWQLPKFIEFDCKLPNFFAQAVIKSQIMGHSLLVTRFFEQIHLAQQFPGHNWQENTKHSHNMLVTKEQVDLLVNFSHFTQRETEEKWFTAEIIAVDSSLTLWTIKGRAARHLSRDEFETKVLNNLPKYAKHYRQHYLPFLAQFRNQTE